jgi:hypothetical protein
MRAIIATARCTTKAGSRWAQREQCQRQRHYAFDLSSILRSERPNTGRRRPIVTVSR